MYHLSGGKISCTCPTAGRTDLVMSFPLSPCLKSLAAFKGNWDSSTNEIATRNLENPSHISSQQLFTILRHRRFNLLDEASLFSNRRKPYSATSGFETLHKPASFPLKHFSTMTVHTDTMFLKIFRKSWETVLNKFVLSYCSINDQKC